MPRSYRRSCAESDRIRGPGFDCEALWADAIEHHDRRRDLFLGNDLTVVVEGTPATDTVADVDSDGSDSLPG